MTDRYPVLRKSCAVLRDRVGLAQFPVVIAWGKHLFPFRTEQLSPTAPMVLGSQGPGRVGRRRFLGQTSRPLGRLVVVGRSRGKHFACALDSGSRPLDSGSRAQMHCGSRVKHSADANTRGAPSTRAAPQGAAREAMKSGAPGRAPGRPALPSSQTGRLRAVSAAWSPGDAPACGRPARVGRRCRRDARVADV